MSGKYQITQIVKLPPIVSGNTPPSPEAPRVVVTSATPANARLDNDVLQAPYLATTGTASGRPISGKVVLEVKAETSDLYVTFGTSSGAAASATAAGNDYIQAGKSELYELGPVPPGGQLWLAWVAAAAGKIRYRVVAPYDRQP